MIKPNLRPFVYFVIAGSMGLLLSSIVLDRATETCRGALLAIYPDRGDDIEANLTRHSREFMLLATYPHMVYIPLVFIGYQVISLMPRGAGKTKPVSGGDNDCHLSTLAHSDKGHAIHRFPTGPAAIFARIVAFLMFVVVSTVLGSMVCDLCPYGAVRICQRILQSMAADGIEYKQAMKALHGDFYSLMLFTLIPYIVLVGLLCALVWKTVLSGKNAVERPDRSAHDAIE
jgi:hypothetical protein